MSNILLNEYYKNTEEKNHKLFILPKKYTFLNHSKFSPIGRKPKNKIFLQIKINPQEYPDKNFFNKKHKIKNNITSSNNLQFMIQNYKDKNNNPSLHPKNIINRNSEKLVNNIFNFSSNSNSNSNNNNKPKVILPHINNYNYNNYNNYCNKKPLMENEKIAMFFRKKLKEISLGDLFINDNTNNIDTVKEKQIKINKKCHSNSEWNLFKANDKKDKNNDDELLNLEDLLFNKNYSKYTLINNNCFTKANRSVDEKYKNGAERLKEIREQKLIDCNKLIKKMKKETDNKKKVLKKYLKIMKKNFENSAEFKTTLNDVDLP